MKRLACAVFAILAVAPSAFACGKCGLALAPPTLREEAANCKIIVFGTMTNPVQSENGGTTDLIVSRILKSDPAIAGKNLLRIAHFVNLSDPANPPTGLVFGDLNDGKLDLYRGEGGGPAVADYLARSLAIDSKDRLAILKYCARFLDHEEPAIARDAHAEFGRASEAEIRAVGRTMDADHLRKFLRSKEVTIERAGLYAKLLAHCGNRSDADLIRELLDKWIGGGSSQLESLMTAFTLLDPVAGWAYTCDVIRDPHNDFLLRYAGLRSVRYFQTARPDVVSMEKRASALAHVIRHSDMADLAIEDLRRWKCWTLTDEVLGLADQKEFDVPIVRRAVLKYALQAPGEQARRFVAAACNADPRRVVQMRELLNAERSEK